MVVSLKLALQPGLTFQKLADGLGLSVSAVHRSVTRAKVAGLLLADRQPNRSALRGGRARERNLAKEHLTRLLDGSAGDTESGKRTQRKP